ncbi:hypothetical protein [Micromonospora narathiwatensis]|uniref:Uncharacterized protein n=1 Tax=Micromonospora narathiwatensis TaxID=299146 RepID=A0A1A8ZAP2_9ACTN|nr:hypothetical protein [Micromonospora narathiwatensis]SBT40940.1 hypothetical protein GA0070621_1096 [Micromonospora narathiwatensis]
MPHVPRRLSQQMRARYGTAVPGSDHRIHVEHLVLARTGDTWQASHVSTPVEPTWPGDILPTIGALTPPLIIVLTFGMLDQPAILRALLQQGSPVVLAVALIPLILPLLGAVFTYFGLRRWSSWTARRAGWTAIAVGSMLSIFVPLNYVAPQLGVLSLAFAVVAIRRRRFRALALALIALLTITATSIVLTSRDQRFASSPARDYFQRITVGRLLDGLVRLNIDDGGRRRSVMLVGSTDDYATVIASGYPPKVEHIANDIIAKGSPCQLPPTLLQRSLFSLVTRSSATDAIRGGTPDCI